MREGLKALQPSFTSHLVNKEFTGERGLFFADTMQNLVDRTAIEDFGWPPSTAARSQASFHHDTFDLTSNRLLILLTSFEEIYPQKSMPMFRRSEKKR